MRSLLDASLYSATTRSSHDFASRLKRLRPELCPQTEELQGIITRAHRQLEELSHLPETACSSLSSNRARRGEAAAALNNLHASSQAPWDLRHKHRAISSARIEMSPTTEMPV